MKKYCTILIAFLLTTSLAAQENTIVRGHKLTVLTVDVFNKDTDQFVDEVIVYLYEMPKHSLVDYNYTKHGSVQFKIDPNKDYVLETCKKLYLTREARIFSCNKEGSIFCLEGVSDFMYLDAGGSDKPIASLNTSIGIDSIVVGKTFKLENIYYDLDKWYIRKDARKELNKLVSILENHPSISIELSSHTDSRGSDTYNQRLSQKRAESCVEYLVEEGIDASRMTAQGYGEEVLLNKCEDGVRCSERRHQKNRRTEFKITSFRGEECDVPVVEISQTE